MDSSYYDVPAVWWTSLYTVWTCGDSKKAQENLLRIKEQEVYEDLYGVDSNSAEILVDDPPYRLMKYTEKYSKAPVYKGGVEKYYSMGDKVFPDLIHDLEHAKNTFSWSSS